MPTLAARGAAGPGDGSASSAGCAGRNRFLPRIHSRLDRSGLIQQPQPRSKDHYPDHGQRQWTSAEPILPAPTS